MKKFQKIVAALMVFTMLFGSAPAWATGDDIIIDPTNGSSLHGTVTNPYSNENYVGINQNNSQESISDVNSIYTNGDASQTVYGITAYSSLTISSLAGGIAVNSTGRPYGLLSACGVCSAYDSNLTLDISDMGNIYVNADVDSGAAAAGIAAYANTIVRFVEGSHICASGKLKAYGIYADNIYSNTSVSELGGIEAKGGGVYGIWACSSRANVSFAGTDRTINATATSGDSIGIYGFGQGATASNLTVSNLRGIEVNATGSRGGACGISTYMGTTTEVTFATGGYINATSKSGESSGIRNSGNNYAPNLTVNNLRSIEVTTSGSYSTAYGICACSTGSGKTTVNFVGTGGEAIKLTTAWGARSILAYDANVDVNFTNSILSGEIYHQNYYASTGLSLNFDADSKWNATNVNGSKINVSLAGKMDTRATGTAKNKQITLGSGTFEAKTGSEISFDAVTTNYSLTTDQITAASATGTIALGSVNVTDSATDDWAAAKEATVFNTGSTPAEITITGTTTTTTTGGRKYTFTGLANGKVSAKVDAVPYTLPQTIQANPQKAGKSDTYSMTADETMTAALGELNNQYRTAHNGFTLNGNDYTLTAASVTNSGVTINAGDTMTVQDVTASGFDSFAANNGTLTLSGVTFSGTTGSDVITGTGTTAISGAVTADADIAQTTELKNGAALTFAAGKGINSSMSGEAKGLYVNMADATNTAQATFGTGSYINATSAGNMAYGIYAIGQGTTKVTDLASITVNGNGFNSAGIYSESTGVVDVKGVNSMEVVNNTGMAFAAYGYSQGGCTNITFSGTNSSVNIAGQNTQIAGLYPGTGLVGTIKPMNIVGASDRTKVTFTNANKSAGITAVWLVEQGTAVPVSLENMDITDDSLLNESTCFAISAFGMAGVQSTVALKNTLLKGNVSLADSYIGKKANLKVTLDKDSVWQLNKVVRDAGTAGDNESLSIETAGTIDTRATGTAANKEIVLGTNSNATFTATSGAKISFDAVTSDTDVKTDQIKAASATGTIAIGSVNVKDTATADWTDTKEATLFDTGATAAGITVTGETVTAGQSRNYTFTGLANGKVAVKVGREVVYTLPQVVQATPAEAGKADTYSFDEGDISLNEQLGLLNNDYRTSGEKEFTINGNGHTLTGATAVTDNGITVKSGDTLNLTNITVKGFDTFATNAGTINFDGVTVNSGDITNTGTLAFKNNATTFNGTTTLNAGSTIAFHLDNFAEGATIVNSTANPIDITNATVKLYHNADKALYADGKGVTLIEGATGTYAAKQITAYKENEALTSYKYDTALSDGKLTALAAESGPEPEISEEAKSLSEGRLGGAVALTQANDMIADAGMANAVAAAMVGGASVSSFGAIEGSHGRYTTGSHVDMNSFNVVAGLAKKLNDNTIVGAFIEGGNSRYSSYNQFTSGELRADGDINYFGAGILARYDFKRTDKGNFFVDATFGAGHTNQDYNTDKIGGATNLRYDAGSAYLKAHATFGYDFNIAQDKKVDAYLKYLWAHQNGDNPTLSTGEVVNFDAINSHRLRIGARYSQAIKKSLAWYGGLAYEYEFDMKAGANSQGLAIAEPDLKGGSGMAELGLKFAPENAKGWKFDAGLQGFTGKRDSLGVRLGAWYEF